MNPDANHRYAVGVDVGGSHICSAVIDLDTTELVSEPISTDVDSQGSAEQIIKSFAANLNATVANAGVPVSDIGLAFPGPFDYAKGICLIKGVHKYESIYGFDIGETLRPLLNVKDASKLRFRFVNDASGFALGESFAGAGKGYGRVMAITLGTGVGSGFVVDGKLDESSDRVPKNGEVWNIPFEGTIVDDSFSTRWFIRTWKEKTGQCINGAKDVADLVGQDSQADTLMKEYGTRLASFCSPVATTFGAEAIILGGNISRSYPLFKETFLNGLDTDAVTVKLSQLRDKAAMLGAASLFI